MVGEIRDNETAQIAINSALTGHLVFTTVHANNVLDVLGRFLNMGVEAYQFVSALNCVLAQRLVRIICAHCKRPVRISAALLAESGLDPALEHTPHLLRGRGLHRVQRHRLQGPHGDLRAARPHGPHSRDDSREAADLGDQEGRPRGGHAFPARVGRRARHARRSRRCARSTRSPSSNEHPPRATVALDRGSSFGGRRNRRASCVRGQPRHTRGASRRLGARGRGAAARARSCPRSRRRTCATGRRSSRRSSACSIRSDVRGASASSCPIRSRRSRW